MRYCGILALPRAVLRYSYPPYAPLHYFLCVFRVVPSIVTLCETTANWKRLLIQNYWNFDLECKHSKHETTFWARKVTPRSPRINVTGEFRETDPWCDCRRRWTQLTVFRAMSSIPLTFIQFNFSLLSSSLLFGESGLKSSVFQLLHKFHILWHRIWSRHFRLDCSRTLE